MPWSWSFLKPKTPAEAVDKTVSALGDLEVARREKQVEKAVEQVAKYLQHIKLWLFGDDTHEPTRENVLQVAVQGLKTGLVDLMVKHLAELDFESRKDAAQVFGACVRIKSADDVTIGAQYVLEHTEIIDRLFEGYEDPNVALCCGSMIRDLLREEAVAKHVIESPHMGALFEKVDRSNFEVASDAFSTFRDLLTRHKAMVSGYLWEHYADFFGAFKKLLQSSNYVTRRQSLKLLGELLLDRSNIRVMLKYVSDVTNLMQMMMLLKDTSRSIQFEAFHVFKVFVANPNKPAAIQEVLANNKEKLLKYLEDFHTDKDDDEQFREEKAVIIQEISTLNQPAAAAAAQGSGRRSVDAVPTESKVVALAARPDTAPAPPTQAADASGGSIPAPPADAS